MEDKWDVVIIGAGPSGSTTAFKLAEKKIKTLLIDMKNLPRYKPCTGIISPKAIEQINSEIGKFPEALCVCQKYFKRFKYKVLPGESFYSDNFDESNYCYSVFRHDFDFWLTLKASEKGAVVWDECIFLNFNKTADPEYPLRLTLRKKQNNGATIKFQLLCKYLVGADGLFSRIRRTIYPETRMNKYFVCHQEYFLGSINLDSFCYYVFLNNPILPDPFWIFFKDQYIVIGLEAYPKKIFKENREKLLDYLKNKYCFIINGSFRVERGVESTKYTMMRMKNNPLTFSLGVSSLPILLTGEAAELVDIGGEGIPAAIESGKNAALAILSHSGDSDYKKMIEFYHSRCSTLTEYLKDNWKKFETQLGSFFK